MASRFTTLCECVFKGGNNTRLVALIRRNMNMWLVQFFMLFSPFLGYGQNNPFKVLERDSIVAYEYNGEAGFDIENCIENYPDKIKQSERISESKIEVLEESLSSVDAYGNSTASCFDPHLGLISWKDGEIVAAVSICISCNYLSSTLDIEAMSVKQIKVFDDFSYPAKGFSSETRKVIYEFCEKIGYTQYIGMLDSIFDK